MKYTAATQMALSTSLRSASNFVFTLRALVVISYFTLTLLFYIRAPSSPTPGLLSFPSHSAPKLASKYKTVGVFGDVMVALLGSSTAEPFTVFVPSHAAFQNASSMFRNGDAGKGDAGDVSDMNSAAYAVMTHLLSFSAVPRSILSKDVPFGKEVVYETISGFLLSVTRVRGMGLLVNNITCEETDLRRGRLVLHVLNGVVMNSEFRQSMLQENTGLAEKEDVKPDWEEEEQVVDEERE